MPQKQQQQQQIIPSCDQGEHEASTIQDRVRSLLAYQRQQEKLPMGRKAPKNLAITRHFTEKKVTDDDYRPEKIHENLSVRGLRIDDAIKENRLDLFVPHSVPIRAVFAGWNPIQVAREMLEDDGKRMVDMLAEVPKIPKRCNDTVSATLHRPGPPLPVTEYEYAVHIARSEGQSYEEWCQQEELNRIRGIERRTQVLLEERRSAEIAAKDPKPHLRDLEVAQAQIVSKRLGVNARTVARERYATMIGGRWRRFRSCMTAGTLLALRANGFGFFSCEEQGPIFVEPDLVLGRTSLPSRDCLLEIGVTHIVLIAPFDNVLVDTISKRGFFDDFVYCRVKIGDDENERQDLIKAEYDMARRFIKEAHSIGGRVLVCCDDGVNRSPALIAAYWLWERGICLRTAYSLLILHEPDISFSRPLALFLTLIEIESRRSTSVPRKLIPSLPVIFVAVDGDTREKNTSKPIHHPVLEAFSIKKRSPYPVLLLLLRGDVGIPDPYSFWYGKPRRDHPQPPKSSRSST